jgi:hypothetical protein
MGWQLRDRESSAAWCPHVERLERGAVLTPPAGASAVDVSTLLAAAG